MEPTGNNHQARAGPFLMNYGMFNLLDIYQQVIFRDVRDHVCDGHFIGKFGTVIRGLDCFSVSFPRDVRGESVSQSIEELGSVMDTLAISVQNYASLVIA